MQKLLHVLPGAGMIALVIALPSCKKNLKADGDGGGGVSTVPRAIGW